MLKLYFGLLTKSHMSHVVICAVQHRRGDLDHYWLILGHLGSL